MATMADKQSEYYERLGTIYDEREARTITHWVMEDVLKLQSIHMVMDRFLILTTDQEEVLDDISGAITSARADTICAGLCGVLRTKAKGQFISADSSP
jgi:diphthamide synthase (EF-2-diphthine--ammonia ligase)